MRRTWLVLLFAGACLPWARAQFSSESDGSDGVLQPTSDIVIDLSQATTASWDTPSPDPGYGVYDPDKWVVVFKYTMVTIPEGVTVTFINHPSGAPVVWLAQYDVVIEGTVNLDGAPGSLSPAFAVPGPGGFAGGRAAGTGIAPSAGMGPGGARPQTVEYGDWYKNLGSGGGYATPGGDASYGDSSPGGTYGNTAIVPLIGGSGGSGCWYGSGGAGGGAILIASSGDIIINGTLTANGGGWSGSSMGGGGSGGAIRLVANAIDGLGTIRALGGDARTYSGYVSGDGGEGRIRFECTSLGFDGDVCPPPSYASPSGLFPSASAPTLRLTQIDNYSVPEDPWAGILTTDVAVFNPGPSLLHIEATHIPVGTTVTVYVVPEGGDIFTVTSEPLDGTDTLSTTTAYVLLPQQRCEVYLRASWLP